MKKITNSTNEYYTDPILFEEGFFKDKKDEDNFLKKVEKMIKPNNILVPSRSPQNHRHLATEKMKQNPSKIK
jgi:hypothetical protein